MLFTIITEVRNKISNTHMDRDVEDHLVGMMMMMIIWHRHPDPSHQVRMILLVLKRGPLSQRVAFAWLQW